MKTNVKLLAVGLLICTLFTACSTRTSDSATPEQDNSVTAAAAETAVPTPSPEVIDEVALAAENEMLELAKYNAYVDLNNFMTGRLQDVLNDYFEEFGVKSAPVIDKYFSATLLSITKYDDETINNAFDFIDKAPSFEKLDPQAKLLKPALQELTAVLGEAHEYYEIKGYVDDEFAGSKTLHSRILKANAAYEETSQVFYTLLGELADERTKVELQQYKDNDQLLKYSVMMFMLDAENLRAEMDDQGILADNILELDMVKFKAKYDVLTEDLKQLTTYSNDETRVAQEGFEAYSLESFVDQAKEVKIAAAEIIERVNKKQRVEEFYLKSSFFRETQDGTPEKFGKTLSLTIDRYNQMQ
ncbi:YiiG family protein [Paenibacillus albidus]|uniref:YiiG family protein n=1 Tax=Paenibacillus albidus TaxID=2041023 RepID=UPI001BE5987B|nr:YiiG family protein [Paenibacillus albidus]MBT2292122.1 YiiG family protein [Paenibacillus albidus]